VTEEEKVMKVLQEMYIVEGGERGEVGEVHKAGTGSNETIKR
jgi:hypothetical protein